MAIGMFGPGVFSGNTPSENISWCIYAAHHENGHRVVNCIGKVLPGRCDWGMEADLMDMFGPGEDVSNELPLENARITGRSPYLIPTRGSEKAVRSLGSPGEQEDMVRFGGSAAAWYTSMVLVYGHG